MLWKVCILLWEETHFTKYAGMAGAGLLIRRFLSHGAMLSKIFQKNMYNT